MANFCLLTYIQILIHVKFFLIQLVHAVDAFQNFISLFHFRFEKVPLITPNGDCLVSEISFEVRGSCLLLHNIINSWLKKRSRPFKAYISHLFAVTDNADMTLVRSKTCMQVPTIFKQDCVGSYAVDNIREIRLCFI